MRHSLSRSRPGSRLVTHRSHLLTGALFTKRADRDVSDRSLEFDEGMCTVVAVGRDSLTVGAEVRIVTDRALVANSRDVLLAALAERTIAEDTEVNFTTT